MQINGLAVILIQLDLQNQMVGQGWPISTSLPTPALPHKYPYNTMSSPGPSSFLQGGNQACLGLSNLSMVTQGVDGRQG